MRLSTAASHLGVEVFGKDVWFSGCSVDSRTIRNGNLFIALRGEKFDGHAFIGSARGGGASAALVEELPEEDQELPVILTGDARLAMGKLAGYWRNSFNVPLVAITGSNGKTTVKEMVSSILGLLAPVLATRGNLNNDIGVPLTLYGLGDEHKYAVVEMGANHPGEIEWLSHLASPTLALITQCAPAHLEGFGSVEGVARAKAEIYSGLPDNGIAIVNADDTYAEYWKKTAKRNRQISFGLENAADIMAVQIEFNTVSGKTGFLLRTPVDSTRVSLPLSGRHNVMNALAAAACCTALQISLDDIRKGLESSQPIKGRMQMIRAVSGARMFDDTYNANPASLQAGLKVLSAYPGKKWLILGDMGELGESSSSLHREAGVAAREAGVDRLFALGDLSRHAVEGFGKGALHFQDPGELLAAAGSLLTDDITVLVKGSRLMAMDRIVEALAGGD